MSRLTRNLDLYRLNRFAISLLKKQILGKNTRLSLRHDLQLSFLTMNGLHYGPLQQTGITMNKNEKNSPSDMQVKAIGVVYDALRQLDADGQQRVTDCVSKILNLAAPAAVSAPKRNIQDEEAEIVEEKPARQNDTDSHGAAEDGLEGISPIAQKWIRRSGLDAAKLSSVFSLGVDEIDLVAKSVPGKSVRARMLNVALLKGIASYLSGGVARINLAQLKGACTHYDAFDENNFYKHLKDFAPELSGNKETGYTLTARGFTDATSLIKQMTEKQK